MKRIRTALLGALAASFLVACGSGGGDREFSEEGAAARVEMTTSSSTISSDGRQVVRLFATVKDSGNSALQGIPVAFRASGRGATLTPVDDGVTDVNGQAQAVLSITDPTLRVITVTGDAQSRKASTDVTVIGTSVELSGPSAVAIGKSSVFSALVTDAAGKPVVGTPVRISSPSSGASLASSSTNEQGRVEVRLNPSAMGNVTLSVLAAGATGSRVVRVGSTSVSFESPAASSEYVVSPKSAPVWTPVVVQVLVNGVPPPAGTQINFAATRGEMNTSSALTGPDGRAAVMIHSALAGRTLVSATAPDGTLDVRELYFVGGKPAKIEVQAAPSTVRVNPRGASFNSSQIIAVVRDAVDNRVQGVRVNFSTIDPSAGVGLSNVFAITDESGVASVSFFPGPLPTGTNRITVIGRIDCLSTSCAPAVMDSDSILLTAVKSAMQLRIGTGNEIRVVTEEDPDAAPVYNELPYGVLVTDSAGNPVPGVTLNATVVNTAYRKGFYQWSLPSLDGEDNVDTQPLWRQFNSVRLGNSDVPLPVVLCRSEDLNENLLLDPGEDLNRDGLLTPGNVATVYFGPTGDAIVGTTNDKGSAVMRIRYLRDRGGWVSVKVRVSASLPDGTEGAESVEFRLPVLGDDLSDMAVGPPGAISPYGIGPCP